LLRGWTAGRAPCFLNAWKIGFARIIRFAGLIPMPPAALRTIRRCMLKLYTYGYSQSGFRCWEAVRYSSGGSFARGEEVGTEAESYPAKRGKAIKRPDQGGETHRDLIWRLPASFVRMVSIRRNSGKVVYTIIFIYRWGRRHVDAGPSRDGIAFRFDCLGKRGHNVRTM
jgi:hypothetical protein